MLKLLCLAPILLIAYLFAPTLSIFLFWLSLTIVSLIICDLITKKYLGANVRKNISIVGSSLSASLATFFATNGAFPPVSLIFALICLFHLAIFAEIKLKDLA